ncbi:MAG: hypothetical protein U1F52_15170 [Burkholderiales bacterium]
MKRVTALVHAASLALAIAASASSPAWAQTASKAAVAAEKFGLTESRAAVLALPEVKAWEEKRREQAAKDTTGAPPGGILASRRMLKGVKHWAISFIEDPQVSARKWAVFVVRAADGKIFVESEGGKLITLEDWRKTRPAV